MTINFTAMILAAGYGKRMHPLTIDIPKPLIEINNISLLKNTIDFLFKLGCSKIIINTHFKHELILAYINKNYNSKNIFISYEKEILDTGGGVKNASTLFNKESILVINSDIYWTKSNEKDIIHFIRNYKSYQQCKLLLVKKNNSSGINNIKGDFTLNNNLLRRWKNGEEMLYYSGIQILQLDILQKIKLRKFSFNLIWDRQISINSLYGSLMKSHLFHVGDIKGLEQAVKFAT
tara:strand:+ start:86 stop:787 length:702 start_codon:yes stop_codon:yes gene_type:complete